MLRAQVKLLKVQLRSKVEHHYRNSAQKMEIELVRINVNVWNNTL